MKTSMIAAAVFSALLNTTVLAQSADLSIDPAIDSDVNGKNTYVWLRVWNYGPATVNDFDFNVKIGADHTIVGATLLEADKTPSSVPFNYTINNGILQGTAHAHYPVTPSQTFTLFYVQLQFAQPITKTISINAEVGVSNADRPDPNPSNNVSQRGGVSVYVPEPQVSSKVPLPLWAIGALGIFASVAVFRRSRRAPL